MDKFNISNFDEYRLCVYQMNLMELLTYDIITLEDFNKYNRVIEERFNLIESEVLNGKNEKNAERGK